jgi:hypothetical protein
VLQGEKDRQARSGGCTTNKNWAKVEFPTKLVKIVSPDFMLGPDSLEGKLRPATVSSIVKKHPVAIVREMSSEPDEF